MSFTLPQDYRTVGSGFHPPPLSKNTGNQNGTFTVPKGGLILPFERSAAVTSLPVFCASEGMASILDILTQFVEDEGYQWIVRTAPSTQQQAANANNSNLINASQTYEDQISVPTGSFLTMVGAIGFIESVIGSGNFDTIDTNFRVQWYDAGAQEAVSNGFIHAITMTGKFTPNNNAKLLTTVSANKNLFILPSPLSITSPGQLNVQITNLKTQAMIVDMAFVFAAPCNMDWGLVAAKIGNAVSR